MEELLAVIQSHKKVYELLSNCPFNILINMSLIHIKAKKFHLSQDTFHEFVYIIVSGEVKIFLSEENGRQILLDIYKEGNLVGEQEAYLEKAYSASVENLTDCLLIKIPNNSFIQWVSLDNHFNHLLIQSLCEQMYELTNRAAKYSLSTVKEQVITTLFDLQQTQVHIDKKRLVASVSATPRSVYRILSELEQLHLIKMDSKIITIIDKNTLLLERKNI